MDLFECRCLAPPLCHDNDHADKEEEGNDEGEEWTTPTTRNATTMGMSAGTMTIVTTTGTMRMYRGMKVRG